VDARTAELTQRFLAAYWRPDYRRILDIGIAMPARPRQRPGPNGSYVVSIDIAPGDGPLQLGPDPYRYPFPSGFFDVITCVSVLEHDPMFWLTFLEAARVLSPHGVMYVNVPSEPLYHGGPMESWRFMADAGAALQAWAARKGIEIGVVESFVADQGPDLGMGQGSAGTPGLFNDCVLVFSKDRALRPVVFITDLVGPVRHGWRRA
jgi:SAM-dependent methyltransferase